MGTSFAGSLDNASDSQILEAGENSQLESSIDNSTLKSSITHEVISASQTNNAENEVVIKSNDVTKYYKSSTPFKATFLKSNGKALSNTNVKLIVGGKTITKKTDKNGIVKVSLNNKPGTYKITVINPQNDNKQTNTVKILSTIKSKDFTKVYKDKKKYSIQFLKNNGKALANKNVKIKFNGKKVSKKTNKKGKIRLSFNNLKPGKYKITFYQSNGLKKTNTIKVVRSSKTKLIGKNKMFVKSAKKTLKVQLKDQYDYKLSSNYTIKAKINGKTYKAKTNSNGIATFKLKSINKGIYTIKYTFKAKGYYKSSETTNKITIIPTKNPTFTVKSITHFGKGSKTPFKVKLTSGNIAIPKKTITFKINGKTYTGVTDKNGIAVCPINLDIGKYTVKYSVKKDSLLNSKTKSTKISVHKRLNTTITLIGNNTFYQGSNTLNILLKDGNNNPLSGKTVKLKIKSTIYSATTSSDGIATFNVITPPGVYDIKFKYYAYYDDVNDVAVDKIKVNSTYRIVNGYGYWLRYEHFEDVGYEDLVNLSNQGVTDIFLNSQALHEFGKNRIETWIANVSDLGMKVHFWVQIFRNNDGWQNIIVNGAVNENLYDGKINELKELSGVKGISGINLDYIRFKNKAYKIPGATDAINLFIKRASDTVRSVSNELILSCDLIAKMDKSGYYYGQDYSFISKYMDVVMPMIYKGNAEMDSSWITSTTKWYVDNSCGALVWSGLQTYKSDTDYTLLPINEMAQDVKAALEGSSSGCVLFRWGLVNYIDFNKIINEN